MDNIEKKLDIIINKLENIETRLTKCELSCSKMDEHIAFVEDTYDTLRTPLNYIQSKFSYLTGVENKKELPQIKYN